MSTFDTKYFCISEGRDFITIKFGSLQDQVKSHYSSERISMMRQNFHFWYKCLGIVRNELENPFGNQFEFNITLECQINMGWGGILVIG